MSNNMKFIGYDTSNTNEDYAVAYIQAGFKIVPCTYSNAGDWKFWMNWSSECIETEEQASINWRKHPDNGIAILTGEKSNVTVIDVDRHGEDGFEALRTLEKKYGKLPDTLTVNTPRNGQHYYFKYVSDVASLLSKVGAGIDIRNDGALAIAPPSVKLVEGDQRAYEWDIGFEEIADLPDSWKTFLREISAQDSNGSSRKFELPDIIPVTTRNDTLFRYGRSLRAIKKPAADVLDELIRVNREQCDPPMEHNEVVQIFNSVYSYEDDPDEWKYSIAAWEAETGHKYNSVLVDRKQVRKAGERARKAGKVFDLDALQDSDFIRPGIASDRSDSEIDLDMFHHFGKDGKPSRVFDYRILVYLKQTENIFVLGKIPYLYKKGVYMPDLNGSQLTTKIRSLIYPEFIRSDTLNRIYKLFLMDCELDKQWNDLNNQPAHWINFRNGFYDPKAKCMIPHNPKYLSVNQIPHEYDPNKPITGNKVEEWLQFITPDPDDREMLLQFCGHCLTTDLSPQKFLIITGQGGTGKSTILQFLERVIGSENVRNFSLKELTTRFTSFGLVGKLTNLCAESEPTAFENTDLIKRLTTQDGIEVEAKGKDKITYKPYARYIFSANKLPLVHDEDTDAFYRRLLILTIDRKPDRVNPNLISELEIDYFIRICIRALERMYANAGLMCESAHSIEAVRKLRLDSDPVEAWIYEEVIRDPKGRTKKLSMFESCERYCIDNGKEPPKKSEFFSSMSAKGFAEVKYCGVPSFKARIREK